MQGLLFTEGERRLKDYELEKKRLLINLKDHNIFDKDEFINDIINIVKEEHKMDLSKYKYEVIERNNEIGFYMNWHIDDCSIFKHKHDLSDKENNIPLNDTHSIYHKKILPIYTMIIYLSDEFEGGEFEFINKVIKPKKYDVIIFDSREVHRVRKLRKGIRKNILVKFFE